MILKVSGDHKVPGGGCQVSGSRSLLTNNIASVDQSNIRPGDQMILKVSGHHKVPGGSQVAKGL